MKKILTAIAALAMVAGLASCQKENVIDNGGSNKTTITARFADTKVSYSESGNNLTPYWESGDKVLGLTSGGETFTLEVTSISNNVATLQGSDVKDGSVKLIYVSGISSAKYDSDNKKYVISYNGQKGDKTMPAIMTASGTIDHGCGEFTFDNNGAVIVISNVGAALRGGTIKQVTLYGKGIASSAAVSYTGVTPKYANSGYNVVSTKVLNGVTVSEDGSLSENILMAVSADAQVEKIFIRMSDDENNVYSLESTNKSAIAAGTYRYIRGGSFTEEVSLKDAVLTGVFSVSDDKQVFFSEGNFWKMYFNSSYVWCFADNQYDYVGNKAGNTNIGSHKKFDNVDLFGWSTSSTNYGINASTSSADYSGEFKDWGKDVDDKNTWFTLSKDEWEYLFDNNSVRKNKYKYGKVCGEWCMVLLPDGWTWDGNTVGTDWQWDGDSFEYSETTTVQWSTMEAAGAVCLPAAGYREGNVVEEAGATGYYWSSTNDGEDKAYYLSFNDLGAGINSDPVSRANGYSVRLVSECK